MSLITLYEFRTIYVVLVLAVLLVLFYLFGIQLSSFLEKRNVINEKEDLGIEEGALLGLFAFFLGFTFNMSGARYDDRRQSIIAEANTIGTAILRADLFPDSIRNNLRVHFKSYVDSRIAYALAGIDEDKNKRALQEANRQSGKIWNIISQLVKEDKYTEATRQMVPALNEMIDAVTTRDAAKNARVPESIIYVMFLLAICSAFIVGYGKKGKNKSYPTGLVLIVMILLAIFLIIDLDKPRRGLIKTEHANEKIIELKTMFN